MTPRISVVIPTYKRPQLLLRCLKSVLTQRFETDAYEVIVVDDGHDDATKHLVESQLGGERSAAPSSRSPTTTPCPPATGWPKASG